VTGPLLLALALTAAAQTPPPVAPFSAVAASTAPDESASDAVASLGVSTSAPVFSLEDAVAASVARGLAYLSALEDLRNSRGALQTQHGAYDPTLSLSASNSSQISRTFVTPGVVPTATETRNPSFDGSISQALPTGGQASIDVQEDGTELVPFPTQHQAAAMLTLSQPLLRGAGPGAAYAAVNAAFAALQGADASSRRALEQAIADAENAYWQLMLAEAQEDAARQSMLAGDVLLARNRELEKRRLIAAYDVLTAQAGAAQRRSAFIEAARLRRDALDTLVFTVYGEEAGKRFKAGGYDLRTAPAAPDAGALPDPADAEEAALQSREDLIAQRYGLRQADITLVQLRRAVLPDLSATGSIGGTGSYQTGQDSARWDAVKRALNRDDPAWSLGLTFNFPVLLRADRGRYLSGLAAREKQRLAVVAAENQVRLDVRSALRAVSFERRRWEEAKLAAELFQRELEGERRRLDLGLSDSFRLLQVERDATQAKFDLASARLALSQALTGLRLATGRIDEGYRKSP
jgi:outer membrane protein TolC